MPEGAIGRFLGGNMMEEVNRKVKTITDALVPIMKELLEEQKKTNNLLSDIKEELNRIYRKLK